jgi:two-component system, OmpR family, phosphate regulon response regulator PhoB
MTAHHSHRILYLEDNEDMRYYVSHLLEVAGYEVTLAGNLADGLRLAKIGNYDLYLFDHHLPDGTGAELCKLIRTFDTSTPVLIFSSSTDENVKRAAFSAGAQGYINKTDVLKKLGQTVAQFIMSKEENVAPDPKPDEAQKDFDNLVRRYNADFRFLLVRVSAGKYDCLLTSFLVLKDLYGAIMKLHEVSKLEFRVIPYPLTLRGSDELFAELGFTRADIENINGFLKSIRETQGREFEALLEEGLPVLCGDRSIYMTTI